MIGELKVVLDFHAENVMKGMSESPIYSEKLMVARLERDIQRLDRLAVEIKHCIQVFKVLVKDIKPSVEIMPPTGLSENMRMVLLMIGRPTLNVSDQISNATFLPLWEKLVEDEG